MKKIEINLNKKDLAGIVIAIPHIFDFDYFQTLTGFELTEVRGVIDKLNDIIFTYEYMTNDKFSIELTLKEMAIIDSIIKQTGYLIRWEENIFFRSKNINFEELERMFQPFKKDIEEFYESEK